VKHNYSRTILLVIYCVPADISNSYLYYYPWDVFEEGHSGLNGKELSQTTEKIRKKGGQIKKEETENVYYRVNAV
jgi:hypothetical protein